MNPAASHAFQPDLVTLLASFTGTLAHEIRSPLSVIQNELAYFEGVLAPIECARVKRSCERIAKLLSEAVIPSPGTRERVSVSELKLLLPEEYWQSQTLPENAYLHVYPALLQFALEKLVTFLKAEQSPIRFRAIVADSSCILTTASTSFVPGRLHNTQSANQCDALQQCSATPVPALIEILLLAQGTLLKQVSSGDSTLCYISLPLVNE